MSVLPARVHFGLRYPDIQGLRGHVDLNDIPCPDQGKGTAYMGFGCNMKDACAVGCSTHSCVGHSQHVTMPILQYRPGKRDHSPLRHAGTAFRPGIAKHQDVFGRYRVVRIVDDPLEVGIAVCNDRGAEWRWNFGSHAAGLITAPSGARLPLRTASEPLP